MLLEEMSPLLVFPGERFGYNPLEGGIEGAYLRNPRIAG